MDVTYKKPPPMPLMERFPHLKKLTEEARRKKKTEESPVASLMSRFPDLKELGVKDNQNGGPLLPTPDLEVLMKDARQTPLFSSANINDQVLVRKGPLLPTPNEGKVASPSLFGLSHQMKPPLSSFSVKKVCAEDLFLSSVAADNDNWLQFQVNEEVPASEQVSQLQMWLQQNRPSQVARSQGVGWIAVKMRDKGKKVMEAKSAWDVYEGERTMAVVNTLAVKFGVMGGKWMCHLPRDGVDPVWCKLGMALLSGGLGLHVYMVKVSPVEDIHPEQSRGEHVLVVYNTDYTNTEQVMRVENLLRSSGVYFPLTYKPDIFSALGIYRNNKWGFRPTIFSSRVILREGRSRVETVGTGKWFYNSSSGLQYPDDTDAHKGDEGNVRQPNKVGSVVRGGTVIDKRNLEHSSNQSGQRKIGDEVKDPIGKMYTKTNDLPFDTIDKINKSLTPSIAMRENKSTVITDNSNDKLKVETKNMMIKDNMKANVENVNVPNVPVKKSVLDDVPSDNVQHSKTSSTNNKSKLTRPDWLAKLEELKLRSLDQF